MANGIRFFYFVINHAFDRRTDRPTDISLMAKTAPCIDAAR